MTRDEAAAGSASGPVADGHGSPPMGRRVAVLGLVATFFAGFSAVSVQNFAGWDEWLIVSLTSKGVTSFPYANRPLALLWALPGALTLPGSLVGYWIAHAVYLCLGGLLVFALGRLLAPREPTMALVSAAAALTWVPLDTHRLNPLNNLMYSGATLAALLALCGLVLWARGRGVAALGTGVAFALLAGRSYEGTLGLLAGGGAVLLVALGPERLRPWRSTVFPWVATMGVVAALAGVPLLLGVPSYQVSGLGWDPSPAGVGSRLLRQLHSHLGPLLRPPPPEIVSWRVLLAVLAFGVAMLPRAARAGSWDARRLFSLAVAGVALAVAGWGVALLSPALSGPERMQGFSAPGVGLLLGGASCAAAASLPVRWRAPAASLVGAWIVALGTAHTLALQRGWEAESVYPEQARLLRELVRTVPQVKEPTLVILLDDERVFLASFTFRHVVEYLYSGQALGVVHASYDFLYPTRFDLEVTSEPWPVVRRPWGESVRRFRYDQIIVVRNHAGRLELLDSWPAPPLPDLEGATAYAPRERIEPGALPRRAALLGPP